MELESSSGASTSLHRTILGIIRNEMARGAKGSNGLTAAAIKKLLQHANSASHRSASTEQITTALHSMTLWGKNNATLVQNGTKFKGISKAEAPPPRTASPSPAPTLGASSSINSPMADQTPRIKQPRSNDPPEAPGIDALLLDDAAPEEPTAPATTTTSSSGAANADSLLASKEAAEFIRKQQLSFHNQASSTLELFTIADGMSVDSDGSFLQNKSTQHAKTVFDKFVDTLRAAVNTKIFSQEQMLMLTTATAAIREALRNLVLAGLDTSTITACPFCLHIVASMTQENTVDFAPLVESKPYDLHLVTCKEFIRRAPSLQLEVIRVGPYHHPTGTRPGSTIQQCIDALRAFTIQVHGTDPVKWPRTFDNLHIKILTAVHVVTDAQRRHVRYFHHHWSADPTQKGIEALVSQITTETNTLEALPGDDPPPSDTTGSAPAAITKESSSAKRTESTSIDAPSRSETRPSRSPARSRSPRVRSRGSSLRSASVARSRSLSRTPRGEGCKQHTTRRSTGPRQSKGAVTWEKFSGDDSSSPPSKRPRHSAPRESSSEPSPRNDRISSSSKGPTTAATSKSPPSGGSAPKEAAPGVTFSSSATAMAVLTVMRDNNGTTSSTSSEASIMTKVAKDYPDFSPSALCRATKDLISKGVITTSPSQDNSRDRHLHVTLDLAGASSKGPDPIADVTQHNTRATILELVAKSRRPLGLDFAELWTLYDAAVPATDQMTYLLEFERLVKQKIFVPPKDSPPGTERFIMQADYDYRKDRMATLPSVKSNTGTSSTPSRSTGTSRIPRISDAPPPAVRYTVKPTEEQRATMATHIVKAIKADASNSMAGISSNNVEALLVRAVGDRTSSADVIDLIKNMVATYRITSWTSRSGALMVGPFHVGGKTPQPIPRIRVDPNTTLPDHITRVAVYESLHTLSPSVMGLSELDILRVVNVKLDRNTDPASVSRAIAALLDDEHISILLGTAPASAPAIYSPYGRLITDHPPQHLHGWRGSLALGPIMGAGTDNDPSTRWCDQCLKRIDVDRRMCPVRAHINHILNTSAHPEGQDPCGVASDGKAQLRAVMNAVLTNQDNASIADGGDEVDIITQTRSRYTTPVDASDLQRSIEILVLRNRLQLARIFQGRQHYIITPTTEPTSAPRPGTMLGGRPRADTTLGKRPRPSEWADRSQNNHHDGARPDTSPRKNSKSLCMHCNLPKKEETWKLHVMNCAEYLAHKTSKGKNPSYRRCERCRCAPYNCTCAQ